MGAGIETSGVVLAGGMSRRLGRDKAMEPFGGEPLIRRSLSRVSQVVDETIVVVNDAARGRELPLPDETRVAVDRWPGAGSLGGIFTGLEAARAEWALVVACDMPFLSAPLLRRILSMREGHDAVAPALDGRPEPTHAAYSKACLPHIERRLRANDLKITRFFDDVDVAYLPQSAIEELDADHLSFFNVNTEQDLDRAKRVMDRERGSVAVELFGMARIACGRDVVEIAAPLDGGLGRVVSALADACPELVGVAIRDDRTGLLDSYTFNLNGNEFVSGDAPRLRPGDRLLLFSSMAGG